MAQHIAPFSFDSPAALLVEWGGARRLGELLAAEFDALNILLVTDRFLNEAGVIAPAVGSLRAHGFAVTIFDDVVADPPESVLMTCVARGREADVDLVVGLGGGSSMDIAKLVAVLLVSDQELSELYGIGKVRGARLPLVQVPTTAGTGSEVTNITILTTGKTTKMGVVSNQLYCDRVLLDAELTVGLPPAQSAATGIDAMVHAIEAFTGKHRKNMLSDIYAKEALRMLAANLLTVCSDGQDRKAREAMLLGANFAGQAFSNSPVAAVHALAYPLGGHYRLPHGLTNALMLVPVLRFNMNVAASLYAELADVVSPVANEDVQAKSARFVETMQDLISRSGCPSQLRDVNVPEEDLAMLAHDAMLQRRLLMNNPVEITETDALRLYREAW